jgi:hypothetical protein
MLSDIDVKLLQDKFNVCKKRSSHMMSGIDVKSLLYKSNVLLDKSNLLIIFIFIINKYFKKIIANKFMKIVL